MSFRFRPSSLLLCAALLPFASPAARAQGATPRLTPANSALYIANIGDGSVMRCNGATGKVLSTLGANLNPVGLAIGPDHNLYVTSYGDGTVSRYSLSTSKPLGVFIPKGRGDLAEPVTMAFGPDGNLYVTNNFANAIARYDGRTGKFLGTFVRAKSGGLLNPQNLAFGPSGHLFVGGPAGVLEYGKTGRFVRVFAKPHAGGLSDVGGLTFGPDGNLYVGDWQRNNILRFNGRTGAFQRVFVSASSGLNGNRFILFGPRGGGGSVAALAARQARERQMMAAMMVRQRRMQAAEPVLLKPGTPAPDFAAQAPDGSLIHLSDFKGKPVILDFWSTWCGPCQASMPHLEKVYGQVKDQGVAVLGVCVWDQEPAYKTWLKEKKGVYTFPTAFDPAGRGPNSIAHKLYNVSGIPTQYIIDKDGNVAASLVGYDENDHRLEAALGKLGITVKNQTAQATP